MKNVVLQPAHALLGSLTKAELAKLARARSRRIRLPEGAPKSSMVVELATHLSVDDVTEAMLALFPKRPPRRLPAGCVRLDQVVRLTGTVTVHTYGRASAGQGRVLLEHESSCLSLRVPNLPLFLENRWPVVASDAGDVPVRMLFAGYVGRGRIHPSAGAPPPPDRPFVLDDGKYGVRQGRLRLELGRSGLLSFRIYLMKYAAKSGRPVYILQPIM